MSRLGKIARTAANITTIGTTAFKALKVATAVARLINTEKKYIDSGTVVVANTDFDNTGQGYYLSGVAQGTDYNNRVGNSILLKSQLMRFVFTRGAVDTACRVIIYRDKENRQAIPAILDVLETSSTSAPLNHNNAERFTIIKDMYFHLDTYHPIKMVKFFKNYAGKSKQSTKGGIHLKYILTTSAIGAADENSIFLLFLADSAAGANSPTAQYNNRLRFVDN